MSGLESRLWPECPENRLKAGLQPSHITFLPITRNRSERELEKLRACIARNRPYGGEFWQADVAGRLGLSHTLRNEGRPKAKRSNANETNWLRPGFYLFSVLEVVVF